MAKPATSQPPATVEGRYKLTCNHVVTLVGLPLEPGAPRPCFKCGDTDAPKNRKVKAVLSLAPRVAPEPQAAPAKSDLYAEVKDVPTDNPDATAAVHPVDRLKLAKAEWKALQAWAKAGRTPPRPATPNLDAVNAEHAAAAAGQPRARKAAGTRAPKPVDAENPFMRYVDADHVGKAPEAPLVYATDAAGLVRVHRPTCKPNLPALDTLPAQVFASTCCKPKVAGSTARSRYVPPSKRVAS